jgi:hypothetical protein
LLVMLCREVKQCSKENLDSQHGSWGIQSVGTPL